jgi:dephospho-CoA kinase
MMLAMAKPGQPPIPGGNCPQGLRICGVLGGVGSGKSTVARLLAEQLPGLLLDADQMVAELLQTRAIADEVSAALGTGLTDNEGILSRPDLGKRVFNDHKARKQLESILHPAVRRALRVGLEQAETSPSGWAVLDVPLLLENGLHRLCDRLVFVDVPDDIRAERAMQRHGWSQKDWELRETAQFSMERKKSAADVILGNASGVDHLRVQVLEVIPQLHSLPPRTLRDRWPSPEPSDFWRPHDS